MTTDSQNLATPAVQPVNSGSPTHGMSATAQHIYDSVHADHVVHATSDTGAEHITQGANSISSTAPEKGTPKYTTTAAKGGPGLIGGAVSTLGLLSTGANLLESKDLDLGSAYNLAYTLTNFAGPMGFVGSIAANVGSSVFSGPSK